MQEFLKETFFFDFSSKDIQDLVAEIKQIPTKKEQVIAAYKLSRDKWKYDPYRISLQDKNYIASSISKRESGNCVEKSIILIALLRALNIPARLHLGKVKNHLAVERLMEKFGSDELTPHGMVDVYLNGKWLKMSPAFNTSLCTRFNVEPLEFDGENDSFLQQYNSSGSLIMEYIDDYGYFDDVPLEFMIKKLEEHYPHIFHSDLKRIEVIL